ncbi:hypothetical protein [Xanthomonas vesicatoria]|uniref:hypothetical protein n=1 Tax=Xanthomonas vesicatoria TaxID=56460 RepID=UPI001E4EF2B0|nr:hypothetical protein [Xanthomonas vesicatoria]MCC8628528.1 hypothetical protein [Xanthomonas vesicatoria]MDG4483023.1 hypothetical protein [Xanthomonas vesicatoria]
MSEFISIKRRAFSAVPDDILTNHRLGWTARVVLSWMLGRSSDFKLNIWHVRKTFKLSEQQWLRARREMQAAGYFQQKRVRDSQGKIKWLQVVTDTPEPEIAPTTDPEPYPQKPGYGRPSHGDSSNGLSGLGAQGGKPSASNTKKSSTNLIKTIDEKLPQPTSCTVINGDDDGDADAGVSVGRELFWPQSLNAPQRRAVELLIAGIDFDEAQLLLDELAGVLSTNSIKTTPERWLRAIVSRYERGEFEPVAGVAVSEARRSASEKKAIEPVRSFQRSSPRAIKPYMDQIGAMLRVKT